MNYKIALIRGDGIGPEVVGEAVKVLEAVGQKFGHSFTYEEVLLGGCATDAVGKSYPDGTAEKCRACDAVLLGAVGVPVLANFSGGIDKFVGPTGGFLISFPIMAYIIGLGVEHRDAFKGAFPVAVVVGTVVNYIVGVILFVIVAHSTVSVAVSACVLPFIPTAIIKAVLACVLGLNIRKRIPGVKKA